VTRANISLLKTTKEKTIAEVLKAIILLRQDKVKNLNVSTAELVVENSTGGRK
jgi:hypothetical protein